MECEEYCDDFKRIGLTACEGCAGRKERKQCQEQDTTSSIGSISRSTSMVSSPRSRLTSVERVVSNG